MGRDKQVEGIGNAFLSSRYHVSTVMVMVAGGGGGSGSGPGLDIIEFVGFRPFLVA